MATACYCCCLKTQTPASRPENSRQGLHTRKSQIVTMLSMQTSEALPKHFPRSCVETLGARGRRGRSRMDGRGLLRMRDSHGTSLQPSKRVKSQEWQHTNSRRTPKRWPGSNHRNSRTNDSGTFVQEGEGLRCQPGRLAVSFYSQRKRQGSRRNFRNDLDDRCFFHALSQDFDSLLVN